MIGSSKSKSKSLHCGRSSKGFNKDSIHKLTTKWVPPSGEVV